VEISPKIEMQVEQIQVLFESLETTKCSYKIEEEEEEEEKEEEEEEEEKECSNTATVFSREFYFGREEDHSFKPQELYTVKQVLELPPEKMPSMKGRNFEISWKIQLLLKHVVLQSGQKIGLKGDKIGIAVN
jgi:hypothetical protein